MGLTACGSDPSSSETSGSSTPSASDATTASASPSESTTPEKEAGTRDNPVPLGTAVENDEWRVTVNSVTPDATAEVLAANEFNDAPDEGTQYLMAHVTVSYSGEDSEMVMMGTSIDFVTATGETISSSDAFVLPPEELDRSAELFAGGTEEGNVVLQVPEGADGLLRVSLGVFDQEDTFVALD